jgi:acetolactate synthase-1/2/3 large subunit
MQVRVSDYIAQYLKQEGVDTVFMLNGGGMMHLVDAMARCEGLRYVCNHHEQASAMAADGYARQSGQLAVCYATAGPGATNVLTGVVGAWQDSSPCLFLTGQSKKSQTIALSGIPNLRQFGTFEVDIVPMVQSVTKYSVMLIDPHSVKYHLEKAIHLAKTGRPGPVLIDIPLDVQGALVDPEKLEGFIPEDVRPSVPTEAEIQLLCEWISQSARPLFLVGAGVRIGNACDLFCRLLDQLQIPVVSTQLGKDALFYDHPLFVGHAGPKGDRPGNLAVQTADLIITVGSSLHGQTVGWEAELFAPTAKKVQVDLDPSLFERAQVEVDLRIQSSVLDFFSALFASCEVKSSGAWTQCCASWKKRYAVYQEPHLRDSHRVNFYHFAEALSQQLPEDATVVTDAGSAFYVMGQGFRLKKGQRFISSGSLGAMGFALPAANGAAFAKQQGPVVCVTGDGSLMTNVHDLAVTRMHHLNVKLFVVNNDGYVSMRNTHRDFFGGLMVGSDADSGVFIPALKGIAEVYEWTYLKCDQEQNLSSIIQTALLVEGPVFVEIMAMSDQKIIPSVASKRMPNGQMVSTPLHDMVPHLPDHILEEELLLAKTSLGAS